MPQALTAKAIEYLTIDGFAALSVWQHRFHMIFELAIGDIADGAPACIVKTLHAPKCQTIGHAIATADAKDRFHQRFRDLQWSDLLARQSVG